MKPISLAVLLSLSACGVGLSNRPEAPPGGGGPSGGGGSPGGGAVVASDPGPRVGVNDLSERERKDAIAVAKQLFAPCPEHAVPLDVCVDEARACAACEPMLDLVAFMVSEGVPPTDVKAAAMARFSAETKKVVPAREAFALGPADAKVTIVAYSDFQCPACKATFPKLEALQAKYPKEVRLEHRFYPLSKHPRAKYAALAAIAAGKQQKFFAYEKLVFANQQELEESDLEDYAEDVGLDLKRFHKDRAAAETLARVEQDIKDAEELGLTHTPFVLINGRVFDSAYFRFDRDLEDWIKTEITLAAPATAEKPAAAAPAAP